MVELIVSLARSLPKAVHVIAAPPTNRKRKSLPPALDGEGQYRDAHMLRWQAHWDSTKQKAMGYEVSSINDYQRAILLAPSMSSDGLGMADRTSGSDVDVPRSCLRGRPATGRRLDKTKAV